VAVVAVLRPADHSSDLILAIARQAARDVERRLIGLGEAARSNPTRPRARRPPSRRARFGWSSLSPTELVVADLAARGRTNREIGAALYISPHTVDSHIRHIYAKLGVSSRVELTRFLLASGSGGARW
jgi:DNA-binding CsgD family transcriptional regulator